MTLPHRRALKRAIDSILIVVAAPIVLIVAGVTAVAVRVSMGAPVMFRQTRVGLHEGTFLMMKFRTMSDRTADTGELLPDGERLTRVGRLLRKFSLDELPQLANVLRGEMALVGPRPLLPEYLPFYRPAERARHDVRPGITGVAQLAGRNGLLWDERLLLDAQYATEGTITDDIRILFEPWGACSRAMGSRSWRVTLARD